MTSIPWNVSLNYPFPDRINRLSFISLIISATTDSTSSLIRLNSSKHAHAPWLSSPQHNMQIIFDSIVGPQLKTMH